MMNENNFKERSINGGPSSPVEEVFDINTKEVMFCMAEDARYKSMLEFCTAVANSLPQRQTFYTLDLADVLWKIQEWKSCLPNVEIFYAVKANSDPILLKLLSLLGLSFDCASQGEIELVMSSGSPSQNIIFAHTIKTKEELEFSSAVGVDLMTFDNEEELQKIHRYFPNARLLLRLRPSKVSCSFDLSDKFGCSETEALQLLALAKQLDLKVVEISFHVGSLSTDPTVYTSTIHSCRRLFDKAGEFGFKMTVLDIGGGFKGGIGTEDLFHEAANNIQQALKECFPGSSVRIIAEPGCYIVQSAVRLICTIIGKRTLKNSGRGTPSIHYYFNDSISGSFFREIERYGIQPKPLLPNYVVQSRPVLDSRIFGQTYYAEDTIRNITPLLDMEIGERVVWENMGAYSRGMCSSFCGMPLPEPRYLFVYNEGLKLNWIDNKVNVQNFLKDQAEFI